MREGWEVKSFEDCINRVRYPKKILKKSFLTEGEFPIISQEQEFINGYWDGEEDVFTTTKPVVIFGDHTKILKYVDFDFVLGADGVKILQPRDFLYPKYFFYFLMAFPVSALGYARHYRVLKELSVSFPTSLAEQKRIVALLDEAFAGIAVALAAASKNLKNARELFESSLNSIFEHGGEDWVDSTLGDVCTFHGGSQPPKALFSSEKTTENIRLIQIRDYKSDKYIVYIPKEKARKFCNDTDVMIGRYGPPLFQILRGIDGAYNVALMKAAPNESLISKDFLFYFLKNGKILRYINMASNRAAGQIGLNKATLEPYPISFPSVEEQQEIVLKLKGLYLETQRLEALYQQKIDALNELKQSLLQKAFAGELTAEAQPLEATG